jgi:Na+-translocating ferredoxin:NAD+ oxidoreductase RnfE subunit
VVPRVLGSCISPFILEAMREILVTTKKMRGIEELLEKKHSYPQFNSFMLLEML